MNRCAMLVVLVLLCAMPALAQPVVDGTADAAYGAALSTQNTRTGFGDANTGDPANGGGGSEIDQVYGVVSGDRLYVVIAGNLETNFNKLDVFIDSKAGGINFIDANSVPAGVDEYCCMGGSGGALQSMDTLTFDSGFDADYYLTFTSGWEHVNPGLPGDQEFWAMSAHYADLTDGTGGAVVAAGMQLAPKGLPNVLRAPGDYNHNGTVDAADYTVWRDTLGSAAARGEGANASPDEVVGPEDYGVWKDQFGKGTTLGDYTYAPGDPSYVSTEALIGPAVPGLGQGELIDRDYALGAGGCTDDSGAGCTFGEEEFALDVDPMEVGTNESNHRNFNNTIDLRMALDNSNTAGVWGSGDPGSYPLVEGEDDPENVTTGIEFSIPLSAIGDPTGDIKITAFINNGSHDYLSNQVSGEGIVAANIGNLMPDFEVEFDGNQYVTVPNPGAGAGALAANAVPEPASVGLAIVAALAVLGLKRRA
jgi:hypothetical protein